MKYVKWIFVVLLIGFDFIVKKDKPTGGLNVGDIAPDFKNPIYVCRATVSRTFRHGKENTCCLAFGQSYDAHSRMQNASLSNASFRFPQ